MKNVIKISISLLLTFPFFENDINGQDFPIQLYPYLYETQPEIQSPCIVHDTIETLLILTKNLQFGICEVTLENGGPLFYSFKLGTFMGKDQQLTIGSADFPSLAKTGLHTETEINSKIMITGIPINTINCTAKPNAYSISGFLAEDEDIISVLKGDNTLVKKLGLTHPQLAKPLFQIWNLIIKETELGNWGRFYDNIPVVYYNHHLLNLKASSSKGWQISIFQDEIQGRYNIHIDRKPDLKETKYLNEKYANLTEEEFPEFMKQLSSLDFSEMLPYYILRYGFYEGHVDYRCDPIAISFIFGLKSLEEINAACNGDIYNTLKKHFISK